MIKLSEALFVISTSKFVILEVETNEKIAYIDYTLEKEVVHGTISIFDSAGSFEKWFPKYNEAVVHCIKPDNNITLLYVSKG